ncbi:MAG: anti-sigma factor [Chloroflexota bacterium]
MNDIDNGKLDAPIEDLLAFYALGALTEGETAQVEAYLDAHPEAQITSSEFQETISSLNLTVKPETPSETVKEGLFARIADQGDRPFTDDDPMPTVPTQVPSLEPKQPNQVTAKPAQVTDTHQDVAVSGNWLSWFKLALWPVATAAAVFLVIFLGWIRPLQQQVQSLDQLNQTLTNDLTNQQDQIAAINTQVDNLSLEPINASLASQAETLNTLASQVVPLQEENLRLQSEVATLSEQLNSLDEQFAPLQIANETLKQDLAAQNAELVSLAEQFVPLLGDEQTLVDALTDQDQKLTTLSTLTAQLAQRNVVLEQRIKEQRSAMLWATIPNVEPMRILGVDDGHSGAHGQLIANPSAETGVLIVTGLPQLAPGQVYQLWFVQEGQFIASDIFTVDENGLSMFRVTQETQFTSFQGMGVTIEPDGGSPQPTNDPVMFGELL